MTNTLGTIVIGTSAPPDKGSGISTFCKELAISLQALGFDVAYVCPVTESMCWFDEYSSINPVMFNPESDPEKQTMNILSQINGVSKLIGVINNDNIFLQSLAPVINAPFLSVVHMLKTTIFESAILNHEYIDNIIVICNDMYFEVCRRTNIPQHKICLVYNGVKVEAQKLSIAENPESQPLILIAGGGYSNAKGGKQLIKLIELLKNSNIDFEYISFGIIPNNVRKMTNSDSRFTFIERLAREDYLSIVKKGDIFLFPSKLEGCPMSLLESMNYGLIPLVSDGKGAMKEIVQHGIDGYLLPSCTWAKEALDIVEKLSINNPKKNQMSLASSKKIECNFNSSETASHLVSLLKNTEPSKQIDIKIKFHKWHRLPIPLTKKWHYKMIIRRVCFRFGLIKEHQVKK